MVTIMSCLMACSSTDSETSVTEEINPTELAQEAASVYQKTIKSVNMILKTDEDDKVVKIEKIFNHLKENMIMFGHKAERLSTSKHIQYQQAFQLKAYDGLDSTAVEIITYKNEMRKLNPESELVIQLEEIMSLSVYADFEQLKRVYPTAYKNITSQAVRDR